MSCDWKTGKLVKKAMGNLVGMGGVVLLIAGTAAADVVLSPGDQSGAAGSTVDFAFSVTGTDAANVAVARFRLALDPATAVITPVLKDATTGEVDCTVASDLADHVTTGPVFYQPTNKRVVVGFGDFASPVTPFGREGVILTCKFTINAGTADGSYPLACSGTPTASDALGNTIVSTCTDGTLTVGVGGGTPTDTPTTGGEPTSTPTPCADVVLGPGNQSAAMAGDTVDFSFSVEGASAAQTAVARFRLALDPATAVITPVLKDATTGEVDCTIASDLADHVATGPVFYQPTNKRVVVGFGDLAAPVTPFGRSGVILTCKFTVNAGTANGTYPLACSGTATASDAAGNTLASCCQDGQLVVGPQPTTPPSTPPTPTNTPTVPTVMIATNTPTRTTSPGSPVPTSTTGTPGVCTDITLTEAITSATTTTIVVSNGGCLEIGDVIQIEGEQMVVQGIDGNTLTVIRGANGTTATTHAAGATVATILPSAQDEDGCQIGHRASGGLAWLLLLPAVGLMFARRRR